ncbi:hypothetical protein LC087_02860 [Bacillus carboniphilus]|uniref:Uncharacterized protein n=1 Tax=Bacillus carboniphilus TaxID=86663 RepID=A0ABY9JUS8_9BACI|nr:hypothetical protein [Bacillus carboniphilus]WLR43161.1 hypothetical protein LC087_02860 [Bacillus carboniphilus]
MSFIKKHIILILSLIGLMCPIVGMLLIDYYYYSSVISWFVGLGFIIMAEFVVLSRPDKEKTVSKSHIKNQV